ncbi:lysophospholipase [Robiginitalea sp. M366]|uniref:alpha/beta hydrolase n=1 Tax=Robiginitalea aestuariiviva TaxID=3036903 RepID=UPI00240DF54C|nr:alpha/beta hydrolase [Robiginitalea aestuariiviva]MDG1572823.1 lysophospholipase [Robiginitalea aestuariiviva]
MSLHMQSETLETQWGGVRTAACWVIPPAPIGVVVLAHGFGEHSGRYGNSVWPLLYEQGWAVLTFDWVGHGQSAGRRGSCRGYDQLLGQLSGAWNAAEDRFPGLLRVLYGHSMGGNLVLNFVLRGLGSPDGVVASSPYLRLAFRPPAWKWKLGRLLYHLAPRLTLASGLDPNGISTDPAQVRAYREDPLVHDRVSPSYSFPILDAGAWALKHAAQWQTPALVLHGTADPIIDPNGSREWCKKAPQTRLFLARGAYHELHHDHAWPEVSREVAQFLEAVRSTARR